MTYIEKIKEEASRASELLIKKRFGRDKKKKIDERLCEFTSDPAEVPERIWAPSQAMTKFQMEQALGDWAEDRVAKAINQSEAYEAIAFGDNDKTMAQDKSFADMYRAAKTREYLFGKRSDLLLFDRKADYPSEATDLDGKEAEALCASCKAALEVRSSRTSVHVFNANIINLTEAGKKPARTELSYTVKVEDLSKVYRWIARNHKPVIYMQVFFDSIYALNFIEVFRFINAKGEKLKLEEPSRSGKFTIMIPLSMGQEIGSVTPPNFKAIHTMHDNGRHDVYAKPIKGDAKIDINKLLEVI